MEDGILESELEALTWRKSKFDTKTAWVPKDDIPNRLVTALEQRAGKFYGDEFSYYLSRSGSVTKYSRFGSPVIADSSPDMGPEPDKKVEIGTKPAPMVCPECGEPMDRAHRGRHHHA